MCGYGTETWRGEVILKKMTRSCGLVNSIFLFRSSCMECHNQVSLASLPCT